MQFLKHAHYTFTLYGLVLNIYIYLNYHHLINLYQKVEASFFEQLQLQVKKSMKDCMGKLCV